MGNNYDVVCFGAHPDDIEFGMGGTCLKFRESGASLLMVSFTKGDKGTYGNPEQRENEFKNAAQTLGSGHLIIGWKDCEFDNNYQNKLEIAKIIRNNKPKIVFAPYYEHKHDHHNGAAHPDHIRCGLMIKDALRFARFKSIMPDIPAHDVKRVYYYMIPREIKPSFVIDVSDVKEKLIQLIKCHESQMSINRKGKSVLDMLNTYREITGIFAGENFCEAFICEEIIKANIHALFTF